MAEYISKELLMQYPFRRNHCDEHADAHFINGVESVFEYIDGLPTAEVPAAHGQWVEVELEPGNDIWRYWECSHCNFLSEAFAANKLYKFCPNCGAKMEDGGKKAAWTTSTRKTVSF